MPVKIQALPPAENLTFHVHSLDSLIGISLAEMMGLKIKAKKKWVYVPSRNQIWDYDTAIVQLAVDATANVSDYSYYVKVPKSFPYIWVAFMACIAGLGLLSLWLKG
jgi:hypothetical protein